MIIAFFARPARESSAALSRREETPSRLLRIFSPRTQRVRLCAWPAAQRKYGCNPVTQATQHNLIWNLADNRSHSRTFSQARAAHHLLVAKLIQLCSFAH
jgi:hypothetical protein